MWKILNQGIIKNKKRYVFAECECGFQDHINLDNIRSGASTKCRKCAVKNRSGEKAAVWTGYKNIPGKYWYKIQETNRRTRDNPFEFLITIEYANDLLENQKFKCALSGIEISLDFNYKNTASLDRIDSTKGYIEGNVQWIHKNINKMKMDFQQDYFIDLCTKIAEYKNNVRTTDTI